MEGALNVGRRWTWKRELLISLNANKTDLKALKVIAKARMWVSFIFHLEMSVSI